MVAFYQEGVGWKSSCGSIFMGMSKVSVCKEKRGKTPHKNEQTNKQHNRRERSWQSHWFHSLKLLAQSNFQNTAGTKAKNWRRFHDIFLQSSIESSFHCKVIWLWLIGTCGFTGILKNSMRQNDVSDCKIETITSSGHTKEMKIDKYLNNLKY